MPVMYSPPFVKFKISRMPTKTPLPPLPSKECIPLRSLVHSASYNFAEKMWQRTSWKFSLKRWKARIQPVQSSNQIFFRLDCCCLVLGQFDTGQFDTTCKNGHLLPSQMEVALDRVAPQRTQKLYNGWMDGLDPTKKVLFGVKFLA